MRCSSATNGFGMETSSVLMHKRTVLHLIERLAVGGAEKLVARLVIQLRRGKYDPLVSCLSDGPLKAEMEAGGVRVLTLNISRRSILFLPLFIMDIAAAITKLIVVVRREKVAVIHAHLPDCAILAGLVGKMTGAKVVVSYHGLGIMPKSRRRFDPRNRLRMIFYRLTMKLSHRSIAVSQPVGEMLRNVVKVGAEKIVVIPNGVDVSEYESPSDRTRVLSRLGLVARDMIVTSVGRLVYNKGHEFLIRGLKAVTQSYPSTRLLLVGDGPERGELTSLVTELGLERHVSLLGERNDIPQILAISHVFALPSLWEGLSVALLEAMAAGKPVVATAVEGNVAVVVDKQTGLLVPAKDSEALALAICRLLGDPGLAQKMGDAGRARVKKYYSLHESLRRTERLYDELVGETMRP